MKKLTILILTLVATINLGSTNKYEYKYQPQFAPIIYEGINDSIPTIDIFGRIRNGIIVDGIVNALNADPSGVKLTEIQLAYIRSLVGGMYSIGTWQKCVAVYGFVGGNEFKHKFNWKDPRDLDAAFRLTFVGGVTHSANGVQFNGSTGYANTFLVPSAVLSNTSTHLYAYIKASSTSTSTTTPYVIGSLNSPVVGQSFGLINRHNGTSNLKAYLSTNPSINDNAIESVSTATPFLKSFSGNLLSGSLTMHNNGQMITTILTNSFQSSLPNLPLYIGATQNGGGSPDLFDNKLLSGVSIGAGLTNTQIVQRDNIWNFSQSLLGRQ